MSGRSRTRTNGRRPISASHIALFDPLGDSGIGGYTHELASALCHAGCTVHVFAPHLAFAAALARPYTLSAAFTGPDFLLSGPLHPPAQPASRTNTSSRYGTEPTLAPYFKLLAERASRAQLPSPLQKRPTTPVQPWRAPSAMTPLRTETALAAAAHLREQKFDTLWSQWPVVPRELADIFRIAARASLAAVHTVHNVSPHEENPGETLRLRALYDSADALVVHSAQAAGALGALLPASVDRIVESRHGTYTIYPRRTERRAPVRELLGATPDDAIVLCFGAVRPYKNTDAVIDAMRRLAREPILLVIAGWEYGFDEIAPGDRLGRTRSRVLAAGLDARIRLLPGPFGIEQTAELFEASDIVAVPYLESSGSGVMCMALTFGKHVICTPVGGMAEYLAPQRLGTILCSADSAAIAAAIAAAARLRDTTRTSQKPPASLHWNAVTGRLLRSLRSPGSGPA